jgi:integrase
MQGFVIFAHAMRPYGSGTLWLRKSKAHPKGLYWLKFPSNGRRATEKTEFCICHTGASAESKALRLLAKQIGRAEAGVLPSARVQRVLVSDLAEALLKHIKVSVLSKIPENLPAPTLLWRQANADKRIKDPRRSWEMHLEPFFGDRKASMVTNEDFIEYTAKRRKEGAWNATINRELAFLRRAYTLGYEASPRLVAAVPKFPKKLLVTERTGFIEDKAFAKLLAAIEEPGLRAMILCAYRLGFRRAEVNNLLVVQVSNGWISLFAGTTKNARSRRVAMPDDVREAVEACCTNKAPDAHVFTWSNGKPIRDFRVTWKMACKAAGVPGLSVHDLRRSFVRNSQRKGINPLIAMKVSGHLTRKVFDAYDVTADQDMLDAAKKL